MEQDEFERIRAELYAVRSALSRPTPEEFKDDIRSGEVGPNILCREFDKQIRAAQQAAYADGWRAGAQAMRRDALSNWGEMSDRTWTEWMRTGPIPEPPKEPNHAD